MPFGAGLGTFVPVFAHFEPAKAVLANTFANRAHNDLLELWLETGLVGASVMALAIVWLARHLWRTWRPDPGTSALDTSFSQAAGLTVVLLAAHSLVDYPLRTGAGLAVLALACGLLVRPSGAMRCRLAAGATQTTTRSRALIAARSNRGRAVEATGLSRLQVMPSGKRRHRPWPAIDGQGPVVVPSAAQEWPDAWRRPRVQEGDDIAVTSPEQTER